MTDTSSGRAAGDPLAQLERAYITEFLEKRGHTLSTVHELPGDQAAVLLKAASIYASGKLTEVESRSHFVDDVHRGSE